MINIIKSELHNIRVFERDIEKLKKIKANYSDNIHLVNIINKIIGLFEEYVNYCKNELYVPYYIFFTNNELELIKTIM